LKARTTPSSDGDVFSIAKVLKLEPEIVHVRIYKQHFQQRPRSIDPAALTLGTIHDKDGFGMGHLPLRVTTFLSNDPRFLTHAEVTAQELRDTISGKKAPVGCLGIMSAGANQAQDAWTSSAIGFYLQRLKLFRN